jgi:tetratricopeptide (TPR) repeat protein
MNDREKVSLLGAAARRLVGAGKYARAPEIARDMWAVRVRAEALAKGSPASVGGTERELARLAGELTRAGRKAEALEVLGAAVVAAGRSGENTHDHDLAHGLAALGVSYAGAGDEARAQTLLRRALQTLAESDSDGDVKLMLLSNLGASYAEAGLKPDARARRLLRRIARDVEAEQ